MSKKLISLIFGKGVGTLEIFGNSSTPPIFLKTAFWGFCDLLNTNMMSVFHLREFLSLSDKFLL